MLSFSRRGITPSDGSTALTITFKCHATLTFSRPPMAAFKRLARRGAALALCVIGHARSFTEKQR